MCPIASIASVLQREKISAAETLLLGKEVDLGSAIGGTDGLNIVYLFAGEWRIAESEVIAKE